MRVLVKQSDGAAKELQFTEGPISIGRGANNRVFLPDKGVSREHAIIRGMGGGKWVIEDLGSSNKTFLNNKAIRKAEIKHGDC
ncbi:MAG: FHA domain-containing protein, partial [Planctomycetota bacterium]